MSHLNTGDLLDPEVEGGIVREPDWDATRVGAQVRWLETRTLNATPVELEHMPRLHIVQAIYDYLRDNHKYFRIFFTAKEVVSRSNYSIILN